jgi:hypothetical protein
MDVDREGNGEFRVQPGFLEELEMTHEYREIPAGDHGNVISIGMADVFAFFGRHSR